MTENFNIEDMDRTIETYLKSVEDSLEDHQPMH